MKHSIAGDTNAVKITGAANMSFLKTMSCAVVVVQVATVASAQGRSPAMPPEIVDGVKSCLSATTEKTVEADRLQADGWHPASVTYDGKPVDASLTFFSKGNLLLMTKKTAKYPACFITATLSNSGTFDDLAYALQAGLGVDGKANAGEKDSIYFFSKGHIVQMTRAGTPGKPAVRVVVGFMAQ